MAAVASLLGNATTALSTTRAVEVVNIQKQAVCQLPITGHSKRTRVTQRLRQQSAFDRKSTNVGHHSHGALRIKYFPPLGALSGSRGLPADIGGGGGLGGRGNGGGRSGGNGGGGGPDGPEDASRLPRSNLWTRYLALLDSRPIATKSVTSMILNMLGDLFCQLPVGVQVKIEKRESLDTKRLAISALLGVALVGPTLHFWYSSLGSIVTAQGSKGAALRLLLDQFVFSPTFISVFFAALLTLEGRPQELVPKLKQDWATTVKTNWKIWIPFQFLNFRLVPPPLQVAAANVIALAWNVYLSFASHTIVEPVVAP